MKKWLVPVLIGLTIMTTVSCKTIPPTGGKGGGGTVNAEDGKHNISELGKWKYGNVMAPSPKFPQCRWEVWGLQRDGWKQLYTGHGIGKVKLPPAGVYNGAYLKSKSCGDWDPWNK